MATVVPIRGRRTGAWLARYALEQLPISHTFGIPGVHTTELYDELAQSEKIQPILVHTKWAELSPLTLSAAPEEAGLAGW